MIHLYYTQTRAEFQPHFTVYRMAERGELPGAKIARRWRFQEKRIERWLEQRQKTRGRRG